MAQNAVNCQASPPSFVRLLGPSARLRAQVGRTRRIIGRVRARGKRPDECRKLSSLALAEAQARSSRQRVSSGLYARACVCALIPPKTRRPCGVPCALAATGLSIAANKAAWPSVEHERSSRNRSANYRRAHREAEDLHLRQRRTRHATVCVRRAPRSHQIWSRRCRARSLS
jgi:hypothetical protein